MTANVKENLWDLVYFGKCGLLLGVVCAQHAQQRECEWKSGGICIIHHKASAKPRVQSFV